ncbi:MAG: hypothetical protein IPK80_22725 [Nannocystis sp.]|nr:hypothetical protein [Nannocystis sp.]
MKKTKGRIFSALALISGCNFGGFALPSPTIHGISVPIPPPSLTAEPVQEVEIEGSLTLQSPTPETLVYLYEKGTDRGHFVFADESGAFRFVDVALDLTNNCMQVWYEEPGEEGEKSPNAYFVASIAADDQSVAVTERKTGCP